MAPQPGLIARKDQILGKVAPQQRLLGLAHKNQIVGTMGPQQRLLYRKVRSLDNMAPQPGVIAHKNPFLGKMAPQPISVLYAREDRSLDKMAPQPILGKKTSQQSLLDQKLQFLGKDAPGLIAQTQRKSFQCQLCGKNCNPNRRGVCNGGNVKTYSGTREKALPIKKQRRCLETPIKSPRKSPVGEQAQYNYKVTINGGQNHDHREGKCGPSCQVDYPKFISDWKANCRFKCSVSGCNVAYADEEYLTTHYLYAHKDIVEIESVQKAAPVLDSSIVNIFTESLMQEHFTQGPKFMD